MCEITVVENCKEANLITHGGRFHADDVFATVILMKCLGIAKVYRAIKLPKDIPDNVIVYDIGFGAYDHHQKGGNGKRWNGVPYASAGLIWRDFGGKLLENSCDSAYVLNIVDKGIIQGIDAIDNFDVPRIDYPTDIMSISQAVSFFNPVWDSDENIDEAFVKAVKFAEIIFDNVLKAAESKAKARQPVEDAISKADGNIMVLSPFSPWKNFLLKSENPKAKEIEFVVFPSNRGGYNWCCVDKDFYGREHRRDVPREWWGCAVEELRKKTGVPTANFCHVDGFIGGAETLEDTIQMVKLASKY